MKEPAHVRYRLAQNVAKRPIGGYQKETAPHAAGMKGGCSPQNNYIFGFFGVKFSKNIEKTDLNRRVPGNLHGCRSGKAPRRTGCRRKRNRRRPSTAAVHMML